MIQIHAKEGKCINLGHRGEDSARVVLFDITNFAEMYGQGEAQLIVKRCSDSSSYLAKITQNENTVSWIIKPLDNDHPGYGNCELVYITGGSVVKSVTYQTLTEVSLSDPISPPPESPDTYGSLRKDLGFLKNLQTDNKEDLVSAINELVQKLNSLLEQS